MDGYCAIFSLFVWIALGVVFDKLTTFQYAFAMSNPALPVSQDRVNVTTWMIQGWWAWLVFGIILPIIFYGIKTAKERRDGVI